MLLNSVIDVAKRVPIEHNVSIRVFDAFTGPSWLTATAGKFKIKFQP